MMSIEKRKSALQKYDPYVLTFPENKEDKERDDQSGNEFSRQHEEAFYTFKEIDFRMSVLKNVMWRYLMFNDAKRLAEYSDTEQEDILLNTKPAAYDIILDQATPTNKLYLNAIQEVLQDQEIPFKTNSELYVAAFQHLHPNFSQKTEKEIYKQMWQHIARLFSNKQQEAPADPKEWKVFFDAPDKDTQEST